MDRTIATYALTIYVIFAIIKIIAKDNLNCGLQQKRKIANIELIILANHVILIIKNARRISW